MHSIHTHTHYRWDLQYYWSNAAQHWDKLAKVPALQFHAMNHAHSVQWFSALPRCCFALSIHCSHHTTYHVSTCWVAGCCCFEDMHALYTAATVALSGKAARMLHGLRWTFEFNTRCPNWKCNCCVLLNSWTLNLRHMVYSLHWLKVRIAALQQTLEANKQYHTIWSLDPYCNTICLTWNSKLYRCGST